MASTTGIELGPDTCVLAGVRTTRSGGADIIALHTIEPAAWPAHDTALAETLRDVRRSKRFPRRARVVAWGLSEDSADDAMSRAAVRPLVDAGFRVDRVVTPPQALAILAQTRSKPAPANTAVVWLALNMHGAAIAIVRAGELLFARTFQWTYNPHLLGSRAQLLQRYSLIAHLAPEVRRGIAAVRASHGVSVEAAVTCGDLPELRSLTMPLIEELDLEVETLDSMEGLRPVGKARFERLAEAAPTVRLASAVALARLPRQRATIPPVARIAAAAALVAALAYGAFAYFTRATTPATVPRITQSSVRPASKPIQPHPSPAAPKPPMGEASVRRPEEKPAPPIVATAGKTDPKPRVVAPPAAGGSTASPAKPERSVAEVRPSMPSSPAPRADVATPPAVPAPRSWTDTPGQLFPPASRPTQESRPPLKEPLPKVDTILIDQERRLAIIDGAVVGPGDPVGPRVVAQIDRDAVMLREPSGLLVRVTVRSR